MTTGRDLRVDIDRSPDAMAAYRLAQAIRRDGGNPRGVMELLARVVESRAWEHLHDSHGESFASFTAFVEAPDPGLGTTTEQLQALLRLRHPHEDADPEWHERAPALRREVEQLIGEETEPANRPGNPHNLGAAKVKQEDQANTTAHIRARLKRDAEAGDDQAVELLPRVISGEMSEHAAAEQKGWRSKRIYLTSPEKIAEKLREHLGPDEIAHLIKLLLADVTGS